MSLPIKKLKQLCFALLDVDFRIQASESVPGAIFVCEVRIINQMFGMLACKYQQVGKTIRFDVCIIFLFVLFFVFARLSYCLCFPYCSLFFLISPCFSLFSPIFHNFSLFFLVLQFHPPQANFDQIQHARLLGQRDPRK